MNTPDYIICILLVIILILICFDKYYDPDNVFKKNIYLDNNATTPLNNKALEAYESGTKLGNASASYAHKSKKIIHQSDQLIRKCLEAPDYLPIYTSGASESNNTILKSISKLKPGSHLITSSYEHKSLLDCLPELNLKYTLIQPDWMGYINLEQIQKEILPETSFISIMHINNEIGTRNNIEQIFTQIKKIRPDIITHSDIVQSFGKYLIPIQSSGIDAVSISYHKIYGPIGVGLLVLNPKLFQQIEKYPLISGSQNYNFRGGTLNIPGIWGGMKALEYTIQNRELKNQKLLGLKLEIIKILGKSFPIGNFAEYWHKPDTFYKPGTGFELVPLGNPDLQTNMSPGTLLLSIVKLGKLENHFCNVSLKKYLENNHVIISIGSACNSDNSKPSHVLYSLGAPFVIRCGVIRISIGDENNLSEIQEFCQILKNGILCQK